MKTKLDPHCADGNFVNNTETGVTELWIDGMTILFQNLLGITVAENSVRISNNMRNDGRGDIVDQNGRVVGSIDYETVSEILTSNLDYASIELARAKLSFSHMRPDELDKQYGSSGQTCREIMAEYQSEVDRIKQCIEWVKNAQ